MDLRKELDEEYLRDEIDSEENVRTSRVKFSNVIVTTETDMKRHSPQVLFYSKSPPILRSYQNSVYDSSETSAEMKQESENVFEVRISPSTSSNDSDGRLSSDQPPDEANMGRRRSLAAQILMAPWGLENNQKYLKRKKSLHGKTIYYTPPSKRKSRIRMMKITVFNFLEQPTNNSFSFVYHAGIFLLVLGCFILSVLSTSESYKKDVDPILYILEIIVLVELMCELIVRFWSAGCRVRYQGFAGMCRFARRPFCVIDIIVVVSSFIVICVGSEGHVFAATAMKGLRFLQILRMFRMDRRGGTWKLLSSVVKAHSKELIAAWYIGFLLEIAMSFIVFQAEKDVVDTAFVTYSDALWWGVVTMNTIGYGDKVPITWVGRLAASAFSVLGISFFALPAGILGSGFALKVQEQHRQKHFARRRMPAASLIQAMWRCYAADESSTSKATWKIYSNEDPDADCPDLHKKSFKDMLRVSNSVSPKMARKSTFRSRFGAKTSLSSSQNATSNGGHSIHSPGFNIGKTDACNHLIAERSRDRHDRPSSMRISRREKKTAERYREDYHPGDSDKSFLNLFEGREDEPVLSEVQKTAVRGIRMMQFMVAKRKFKETLRPYDVKDVIEQYSAGQLNISSGIKNLQNRVEMITGHEFDEHIGNSGSFYRGRRNTRRSVHKPHSPSMNSRIQKVEADLMQIDKKLDLLLHHFLREDSSDSSTSTFKRARDSFKKLKNSKKILPPTVKITKDDTAEIVPLQRITNTGNDETDETKKKNILASINSKDMSPKRAKFARRSCTIDPNVMRPASAWEGTSQEDNTKSPPPYFINEQSENDKTVNSNNLAKEGSPPPHYCNFKKNVPLAEPHNRIKRVKSLTAGKGKHKFGSRLNRKQGKRRHSVGGGFTTKHNLFSDTSGEDRSKLPDVQNGLNSNIQEDLATGSVHPHFGTITDAKIYSSISSRGAASTRNTCRNQRSNSLILNTSELPDYHQHEKTKFNSSSDLYPSPDDGQVTYNLYSNRTPLASSASNEEPRFDKQSYQNNDIRLKSNTQNYFNHEPFTYFLPDNPNDQSSNKSTSLSTISRPSIENLSFSHSNFNKNCKSDDIA